MGTEKGKTFLEYGLILVVIVFVFAAVVVLLPDQLTAILGSLWSTKNIALFEISVVACVCLLIVYFVFGKTSDKRGDSEQPGENTGVELYFNPEVDSIEEEDMQVGYVSDYENYKSGWPGLVELILVVILIAVVVLGVYLYASPILPISH